jgi:hypothetical protein
MSMKKSSDTIGNRSRDLPVCRAVPQPLRHHVPPAQWRRDNKLSIEHNVYYQSDGLATGMGLTN